MKKQTLMTVILLIAAGIANAQNWSLNGNSVTDTSKVGSKNNKPVRFIANNNEWMRLTPAGNLGVGTTSPVSRLHVATSASVPATFDGGANMFISLNEGGVYRGYLGSFAGAATDVDFGTGGSNSTGKLHLTIQASPKLTIDASGKVGIGTTTPESNLHIFRGSAGTVTANANAPLVVENAANNYINLLTPSANESGVLFGDNLNAQDGGIIYTGSNQLQLRTNGNVNRMIIDPDGNTGIDLDPINTGTNAARLQVRNNGNDNIRLVAADNANDWSLWSADGATGNLELYKNGNFRGSFNATSGVYTPAGTPFTKDVAALPPVMESVMKLTPGKYNFKESTDSKKISYGFTAKDVNEVFPELVDSYKDRKTGEERFTVNYDNFGVIAIKAIQEMQKQIEGLKEEVKKLSGAQSKTTSTASELSKTNIVLTGARLEQNTPNPFKETTTISYTLPVSYTNAKIVITNQAGAVIKEATVSGSGKGSLQINTSMLTSGVYSYSLYAAGKLVETKKMVK